jgi:two-component system chemotaxis response regulator CheB
MIADPINVMLCDDSAVTRGALSRIIDTDTMLRIVARAGDGQQAVTEVGRRVGNQPIDVLLLDIEMPVMDGLTAIPLLLRADPRMRIVVVSQHTTAGADVALRAIQLGAADYITKPSARDDIGTEVFEAELLAKLRGQAKLARGGFGLNIPGARPGERRLSLRPVAAEPPQLLAIGSSTGGPQALFMLMKDLGRRLRVPAVLTQHMPPNFTTLLGEHLGRVSGLICHEAADGEPLAAGTLLLAPGDRHMLIEASGSGFRARLNDGPQVNFCRPAVDPMLRSAAIATEGRMLAVVLTGMGQDGLVGTTAVVEAGGTALAQDEATSVVWGMPGAIAQAGLCHAVLPLPNMAAKILELTRQS